MQNLKETPDLFHRTQVRYVDFLRSSFLSVTLYSK